MINNFSIENFLDLTNYITDVRKKRRKEGKFGGGTQEFFTPYSIVKRMCDRVDDDIWADPSKTFLESGFGSGQFVVYIVWNRIQHGVDWETALKTLFGVELQLDNVLECHDRVIDLLTKLDIDFDEQIARKIMKKNLVCSDFFKWDFEHWKKMIVNDLEKKTGIKRFSICLQNPPYDKSLHLKFLEKVIEVTDKVVTVQPVRWIEETVGPKKKTSAFNKYEDSIAKHIKELDIYSAKEAEKLFGAAFNFNVGIYVCDKEGGFDYSKLNTNKILDKVLEKMPDNIDNHIKFNEPNNAIIVSLITGGNDGRNNVIDLYFQGSTYKAVIYDENGKRLDNGLTFYENRKKTAWGNVKVRGEQNNIKFKNIDECINFFNSTRTYLFRYIFNVVTSDVNVQTKFLPFMNDYSEPWTDERMYDYFGITKEEQKEIEERVDKVYNEIQQRIEEDNITKKRRKKNDSK